MRLAFCLVFGFISAQLTAAPIPKEAPKAKVPNYFPCELGTKWEYECENVGQTEMEVTKVRHEAKCKVVTITIQAAKRKATEEEVYLLNDRGVFRVLHPSLDPIQHPILHAGMKPGDEWDTYMEAKPGAGATRVAERETVKTIAGEFETIPTHLRIKRIPEAQLRISAFYAEGVGRVRMDDPFDGTCLLKKFTPPTK